MIVIFQSPSIHRRHNETTTALKRTLISNLQKEAKDNNKHYYQNSKA